MKSNGKVSAKEENGSPSDDIVSPKNTSKRKYLIGPVTFLGLLGYATYASTIFLYYPYNVGKALFPNISVASENSAVCGSNTNGTGVENGQLIQSDVATFLVYSAVLEGIPCILSNLVYGSSSDRFGIKKMLLIPIIGLMLTEGLILVFMHYQFTLLYFLIPLVINGFGGEAFAIIQFTLSYASKITNSNKERTIAMAIMEICIGMGLLLGSITAGYIIRLSGFMWSLITSLLINIVNIVLIFSLPENTEKRNNEPWRVIHVFNSFKDSLQFYYSKKYAGLRLKFILCISIFIIGCVVLIGRNNTEILYTISPPFCLNSIQVGWFHATRGVMQHGIAMILIRLFMMFMRAESIAMIGAVSGTISLIVEGFANSTVVLFLTQVIGFGTSLGVVMVRVIMSREIPAENQGALFGGMSAFQTACTFFGSLIFSTMYRSTLYFFKGTIFLLMAGMFFISLVLTIFLFIREKSKARTYKLRQSTANIEMKPKF